jgi:hypothetical protein
VFIGSSFVVCRFPFDGCRLLVSVSRFPFGVCCLSLPFTVSRLSFVVCRLTVVASNLLAAPPSRVAVLFPPCRGDFSSQFHVVPLVFHVLLLCVSLFPSQFPVFSPCFRVLSAVFRLSFIVSRFSFINKIKMRCARVREQQQQQQQTTTRTTTSLLKGASRCALMHAFTWVLASRPVVVAFEGVHRTAN